MMRKGARRETFLAPVGNRTKISWLFIHCTDYVNPAPIINVTYKKMKNVYWTKKGIKAIQ